MKIIQDYVSNFVAIQIVAYYDMKIVSSFVANMYCHLNPIKALVKSLTIERDNLFFWLDYIT
jgi:hypothetical protein